MMSELEYIKEKGTKDVFEMDPLGKTKPRYVPYAEIIARELKPKIKEVNPGYVTARMAYLREIRATEAGISPEVTRFMKPFAQYVKVPGSEEIWELKAHQMPRALIPEERTKAIGTGEVQEIRPELLVEIRKSFGKEAGIPWEELPTPLLPEKLKEEKPAPKEPEIPKSEKVVAPPFVGMTGIWIQPYRRETAYSGVWKPGYVPYQEAKPPVTKVPPVTKAEPFVPKVSPFIEAPKSFIKVPLVIEAKAPTPSLGVKIGTLKQQTRRRTEGARKLRKFIG